MASRLSSIRAIYSGSNCEQTVPDSSLSLSLLSDGHNLRYSQHKTAEQLVSDSRINVTIELLDGPWDLSPEETLDYVLDQNVPFTSEAGISSPKEERYLFTRMVGPRTHLSDDDDVSDFNLDGYGTHTSMAPGFARLRSLDNTLDRSSQFTVSTVLVTFRKSNTILQRSEDEPLEIQGSLPANTAAATRCETRRYLSDLASSWIGLCQMTPGLLPNLIRRLTCALRTWFARRVMVNLGKGLRWLGVRRREWTWSSYWRVWV